MPHLGLVWTFSKNDEIYEIIQKFLIHGTMVHLLYPRLVDHISLPLITSMGPAFCFIAFTILFEFYALQTNYE